VRVPDLRRIQPFPGLADQFVAREAQRQADAAGIPDALVGPVAPGRKRAGACNRGAASNEMASFQ